MFKRIISLLAAALMLLALIPAGAFADAMEAQVSRDNLIHEVYVYDFHVPPIA